MRIQAVGICRFSILTQGGFKRGPAGADQARADFLFEERRLSGRMAWFRHVVLPSIRVQTDRDFTFVVLASALMPDRWRDELMGAVAGIPEVQLDFVQPGAHWQLCNQALLSRTEPGAAVMAQFRLDDDDALARDYVARIRADFRELLAPLYRRHGAVCADYARGLILEADGKVAALHQTNATAWACAQTVYVPADGQTGLFSWGHHRLHSIMPVVSQCDSNMFLRGRHGTNDSAFSLPTQDTRPWDMGALKRRFDIRLETLQQALLAAG